MLEIPLHAGTEHPSLTLLVLSSILTFILGIGIGTYRERLSTFVESLTNSLTR